MFLITHYIWGPDRVLAKIDKTTNKSYYYLYNGHGDVVQIVDTSGAIKNTYDYDVWGNFLKKEETIEKLEGLIEKNNLMYILNKIKYTNFLFFKFWFDFILKK